MSYFAAISPGLYFVFLITCLFVAGARMKAADRTDRERLPPVPETPDPIEVAYLEGGADQVIRTVSYALVQRGLVAPTEDGKLAWTGKPSLDVSLAPIESLILASLQSDPDAHSLLSRLHDDRELGELLAPVRARLSAQNLLLPVEVRQQAVALRAAVSVLIVAFAAIFLVFIFASGQQENVMPVVLLAAASIVALLWVTHAGGLRSKLGQAYLAMMKLAYQDRLRHSLANASLRGAGPAFDPNSLFLIGLFGLSVLKGTPDETVAAALVPSCDPTCGA